MDKDVLRTILRNQRVMLSAIYQGPKRTADTHTELMEAIYATETTLAGSYLCEHVWNDGFSMGGPTRTCKLCGKWERD